MSYTNATFRSDCEARIHHFWRHVVGSMPSFLILRRRLDVSWVIGESARAVVQEGHHFRRFKLVSSLDKHAFSKAVRAVVKEYFQQYASTTGIPLPTLSSEQASVIQVPGSAGDHDKAVGDTYFSTAKDVAGAQSNQAFMPPARMPQTGVASASSARSAEVNSSERFSVFEWGMFQIYSRERLSEAKFYFPRDLSSSPLTESDWTLLSEKTPDISQQEINFEVFLQTSGSMQQAIRERMQFAFLCNLLDRNDIYVSAQNIIQAMVMAPPFQRLGIKRLVFYGSWIRKILANLGAPNDLDLRIELSKKGSFDAQAFRKLLECCAQNVHEVMGPIQSPLSFEFKAQSDPTGTHWSFTYGRFNVVVQRGPERSYTDRVEGLELVWHNPWNINFLGPNLANFALTSRSKPINEVLPLLYEGLIEIDQPEEILGHGLSRLLWKLMEGVLPLQPQTLKGVLETWRKQNAKSYDLALLSSYQFFKRKGSLLGTFEERWLTSLINFYSLLGYDPVLENDTALLSSLRDCMQKGSLNIRFGNELDLLRELCMTRSPHDVQRMMHLLASSFQLVHRRHPRTLFTHWGLSPGTSILLLGDFIRDWRSSIHLMTEEDMRWFIKWSTQFKYPKKLVFTEILNHVATAFFQQTAPYPLRCEWLERIFDSSCLVYLWERIILQAEDDELIAFLWPKFSRLQSQIASDSQALSNLENTFENWLENRVRIKVDTALPDVVADETNSQAAMSAMDLPVRTSPAMSEVLPVHSQVFQASMVMKESDEKEVTCSLSEMPRRPSHSKNERSNRDDALGGPLSVTPSAQQEPLKSMPSALDHARLLQFWSDLANVPATAMNQQRQVQLEERILQGCDSASFEQVLAYKRSPSFLCASISFQFKVLTLLHRLAKDQDWEEASGLERHLLTLIEQGHETLVIEWLEGRTNLSANLFMQVFAKLFAIRLKEEDHLLALVARFETGFGALEGIVQIDYAAALQIFPSQVVRLVSDAYFGRLSLKGVGTLLSLMRGDYLSWKARARLINRALELLGKESSTKSVSAPQDLINQMMVELVQEAKTNEELDSCLKWFHHPHFKALKVPYRFAIGLFLVLQESRIDDALREKITQQLLAQLSVVSGHALEEFILSALWQRVPLSERRGHLERWISSVKTKTRLREEMLARILDELSLKEASSPLWSVAIRNDLSRVMGKSPEHRQVALKLIKKRPYEYAKAIVEYLIKHPEQAWDFFENIETIVSKIEPMHLGTYLSMLANFPVTASTDRTRCDRAWKAIRGLLERRRVVPDGKLTPLDAKVMEKLAAFIGSFADYRYFVEQALVVELKEANERTFCQLAASQAIQSLSEDRRFKVACEMMQEPKCLELSYIETLLLRLIDSMRGKYQQDLLDALLGLRAKRDSHSLSLYLETYLRLRKDQTDFQMQKVIDLWRSCRELPDSDQTFSRNAFFREWLTTQLARPANTEKCKLICEAVYLELLQFLAKPVRSCNLTTQSDHCDVSTLGLEEGVDEGYFRRLYLLLNYALKEPVSKSIVHHWHDLGHQWIMKLVDEGAPGAFPRCKSAGSWMELILSRGLYGELERGIILKLKGLFLQPKWRRERLMSAYGGLSPYLQMLYREGVKESAATNQVDFLPASGTDAIAKATKAEVCSKSNAFSFLTLPEEPSVTFTESEEGAFEKPSGDQMGQVTGIKEIDLLPIPSPTLRSEDATCFYFFYLYEALLLGQLPWTLAHIMYLRNMKTDCLTPSDRCRAASIKASASLFVLNSVRQIELSLLQNFFAKPVASEDFLLSNEGVDSIFISLGIVENSFLKSKPSWARLQAIREYLNPQELIKDCLAEVKYLRAQDWKLAVNAILTEFKHWLNLFPQFAISHVKTVKDLALLHTKFTNEKPQLKLSDPWTSLLISLACALAHQGQAYVLLDEVLPLFNQSDGSYHTHLQKIVSTYSWKDDRASSLFFSMITYMCYQHVVVRSLRVASTPFLLRKEFAKFINIWALLKQKINEFSDFFDAKRLWTFILIRELNKPDHGKYILDVLQSASLDSQERQIVQKVMCYLLDTYYLLASEQQDSTLVNGLQILFKRLVENHWIDERDWTYLCHSLVENMLTLNQEFNAFHTRMDTSLDMRAKFSKTFLSMIERRQVIFEYMRAHFLRHQAKMSLYARMTFYYLSLQVKAHIGETIALHGHALRSATMNLAWMQSLASSEHVFGMQEVPGLAEAIEGELEVRRQSIKHTLPTVHLGVWFKLVYQTVRNYLQQDLAREPGSLGRKMKFSPFWKGQIASSALEMNESDVEVLEKAFSRLDRGMQNDGMVSGSEEVKYSKLDLELQAILNLEDKAAFLAKGWLRFSPDASQELMACFLTSLEDHFKGSSKPDLKQVNTFAFCGILSRNLEHIGQALNLACYVPVVQGCFKEVGKLIEARLELDDLVFSTTMNQVIPMVCSTISNFLEQAPWMSIVDAAYVEATTGMVDLVRKYALGNVSVDQRALLKFFQSLKTKAGLFHRRIVLYEALRAHFPTSDWSWLEPNEALEQNALSGVISARIYFNSDGEVEVKPLPLCENQAAATSGETMIASS